MQISFSTANSTKGTAKNDQAISLCLRGYSMGLASEKESIQATGEQSVAVGTMTGGLINTGTIIYQDEGDATRAGVNLGSLQLSDAEVDPLSVELVAILQGPCAQYMQLALGKSAFPTGPRTHETAAQNALNLYLTQSEQAIRSEQEAFNFRQRAIAAEIAEKSDEIACLVATPGPNVPRYPTRSDNPAPFPHGGASSTTYTAVWDSAAIQHNREAAEAVWSEHDRRIERIRNLKDEVNRLVREQSREKTEARSALERQRTEQNRERANLQRDILEGRERDRKSDAIRTLQTVTQWQFGTVKTPLEGFCRTVVATAVFARYRAAMPDYVEGLIPEFLSIREKSDRLIEEFGMDIARSWLAGVGVLIKTIEAVQCEAATIPPLLEHPSAEVLSERISRIETLLSASVPDLPHCEGLILPEEIHRASEFCISTLAEVLNLHSAMITEISCFDDLDRVSKMKLDAGWKIVEAMREKHSTVSPLAELLGGFQTLCTSGETLLSPALSGMWRAIETEVKIRFKQSFAGIILNVSQEACGMKAAKVLIQEHVVNRFVESRVNLTVRIDNVNRTAEMLRMSIASLEARPSVVSQMILSRLRDCVVIVPFPFLNLLATCRAVHTAVRMSSVLKVAMPSYPAYKDLAIRGSEQLQMLVLRSFVVSVLSIALVYNVSPKLPFLATANSVSLDWPRLLFYGTPISCVLSTVGAAAALMIWKIAVRRRQSI